MTQTAGFFNTLGQIITNGETATLSGQTACSHIAAISVKAGKIHAIRYGTQVGLDALPAFQTLEIAHFSRKESCSRLCYKPDENAVSNQVVIVALGDRLPAMTQELGEDLQVQSDSPEQQSEKGNRAVTAEAIAVPLSYALSYRGKPVNAATHHNAHSVAKLATNTILSYRGQSVEKLETCEAPALTEVANPPKLQYRGSNSNPFLRRRKV